MLIPEIGETGAGILARVWGAPGMPEMDQGIKRLVQPHPQDVLALVLPGAEVLGVLPVDVATERQQVLDNLLRVQYQGVEFAVDLEVEA